jgi:hypothetical protein
MVKSRIWKDAGIIALSFNSQFNPDFRDAAADCFKIGIKRRDKNEKDADDPLEVASAGMIELVVEDDPTEQNHRRDQHSTVPNRSIIGPTSRWGL